MMARVRYLFCLPNTTTEPQIVTQNIVKETRGVRYLIILSSPAQGVQKAIRLKISNVVMIPPATMRYKEA